MKPEYLERRVDETLCDRRCVVAFVAGATFAIGALWVSKPESTMLPSNIAAARSHASIERELLGCVRALDVTSKTADFWRDAALAMRTDGVDSTKPYKEDTP